MNLDLKGKTALVCGATQGIGLAAARELAELGASCILLARNQARLQEVLGGLDQSAGQIHQFEQADFQEPGQVQAALDRILERQVVQILINNTGGPARGPLLAATREQLRQAFDQHLICNQLLVQGVVPGMRNSSYGRIINVVSTSVKTPLPSLGISNIARWAVASWAKTLATELAPYGITVNNVLPGSTMTERLRSLFRSVSASEGITNQEASDRAMREIPMGRFGDPAEIAYLIAFLASPSAAYITGTNIQVDGGKTPVG